MSKKLHHTIHVYNDEQGNEILTVVATGQKTLYNVQHCGKVTIDKIATYVSGANH